MHAVTTFCRSSLGLLGVGLLFGLGACSFQNQTDVSNSSIWEQGTVTQADGMKTTAAWPAYNGGYDATRFSRVTKINAGNVASLTEVARFTLPETISFQSGPVLADGTLYVTTPLNTYAIDARTAMQRWSHHFDAKSMGLGTPVRGVGYADGRLFRGTPDGHLLALDAKTGAAIWDVVGADTTKGEYYTAAPVVWEGRVFMANSGGDVGAIGHVRAFDAQSGRQLWNFDTVPSAGIGAETWPEGKPRAVGTR